MVLPPFEPPRALRNPHLQSILSSLPPRRQLVRWHARHLQRKALDVVLQCRDGIRLHGLYNPHPEPRRGLAILLHGWEGSAQSNYQLSVASALHDAGFDLFRLHLRDHGPSHHLNPELFNSTRLQEVIDAVLEVQRLYPHPRYFMVGFSLGGNFALRVAAHAPQAGIRLHRVAAVCPVLSPLRTMAALEHSGIYHRYFVRRWKRSLAEKLRHHPQLGYQDSLLRMRTLREMNAYFVPRHTDFPDPETYFSAYALTGDTLAGLSVPSHLITSRDDPIIPVEDLQHLARPAALQVEVTDWGGHCGYLMNWRLDSWVDRRIVELFRQD
jgi:hypothetical protein